LQGVISRKKITGVTQNLHTLQEGKSLLTLVYINKKLAYKKKELDNICIILLYILDKVNNDMNIQYYI
jgi:hypothetical protein